jgi:hypothetical protein
MPESKPLPVKAQKAAVRALLEDGVKLEAIERDHPDLADGLAAVKAEDTRQPAPRRSGSSRPTLARRPRGLS